LKRRDVPSAQRATRTSPLERRREAHARRDFAAAFEALSAADRDFVGRRFLYAFSSTMIHGISRDAEYVAAAVAERALARRSLEAAKI